MIIDLIIFLYCILLVIAMYNLINQYKKKKKITAFICFQVAFIIYYILIPIMALSIINIYPGQLTGFVFVISNAECYDIIYAFMYTLISYTIILISYNIRLSSRSPEARLRDSKSLNIKTDFWNDLNMNKIHKRIYRITIFIGLLFLILGIISELVIANSLGGIFKAIAMGDKLRAFGSDNSQFIPQNRLFTIVLMVSSLVSTYFFVYALRIYKNFSVKCLLLLSILASAFYLMINAGRLAILLFVLTFFIDFSFRKTKHPFIFMCLFSIVVFVLLGALNDLFFYLSYGYVKETSTGILSIINEFAFPYQNLLNVHKINELYGFRLGVDYITWIINIIPTAVLQVFGLSKITTGYHLITEYYSGANALGGIPTDILTLAIRQFGFMGLIIISVLISKICKYMDKVICQMYSTNHIFMTLRISSIMFIVVPYADLDSFVRNRYDMLVVFIFIVVINKIKANAKQSLNITQNIS